MTETMTNCRETCDYVAREEDPSNWYGDSPSDWMLEREVWACPHDALDGAEQCVFHTDPEDVPEDVDEGEQFIAAVNETSAVNDEEIARRRKEFVGATFGSFDISGAVLDADDEYPIRLDHARFACGVDAEDAVFEHGVSARHARFETGDSGATGEGKVSFRSAEFGEGKVSFRSAEFGKGKVSFRSAEFGKGKVSFLLTGFDEGEVSFLGAKFGDGEVLFDSAEFGEGEISFDWAEFNGGEVSFDWADFGKGKVLFNSAEFDEDEVSFHRAEFGEGKVSFNGAEFGEGKVSFHRAEFGERKVSFNSAEFGDGEVLFDSAEFGEGEASFDWAEFGEGKVSFHRAEFSEGRVSFRRAEFSEGRVLFDSAEFGEGEVSFDWAKFSEGKASFLFAEFGEGEVSFDWAEFGEGEASFHRAEFGEGGVSFDSATIAATLQLIETRFDCESTVVFTDAEFRDDVMFSSTTDESVPYAQHSLNFSGATFRSALSFGGGDSTTQTEHAEREEPRFDVVFAGDVDFSNVTFPDGVDFSATRFPADADFTGAILEDADFSDADVTGTDDISAASFDGANLTGANFTRATLAGASFERSRLSRAKLHESDFSGTKLYGALLGDARINRGTEIWLDGDDTRREPDGSSSPVRALRRIKMAFREREPYCTYDPRYRGNDGESDLEKAGEVYATLENLARDNGLPKLASKCFLGRKDVQFRKYVKRGDSMMATRSLLPSIVSRYGESFTRVLLTGLVTVLTCGVAYDAFNLIEHAESEGSVTLFEALYFSGLTFTTLGYGDFTPANSAGQVLAVAETSMGVVLLAILVFVFGRRATR